MTATNKNIPGKRIKTWHRKSATYKDGGSLRAFARFLAQDQNDDRDSRETARKWAGGKVAP